MAAFHSMLTRLVPIRLHGLQRIMARYVMAAAPLSGLVWIACYSASGVAYGLVINQSTSTAETTHPITGRQRRFQPRLLPFMSRAIRRLELVKAHGAWAWILPAIPCGRMAMAFASMAL